MDRALIVYHYTIHRAHARQEKATIDPEELQSQSAGQEGLSKNWENEARSKCEKVFSLVRSGKVKPESREDLMAVIRTQIRGMG
jgi:hypothetical protein